MKPLDDFAVIVTSDATVTVYTAKSQSLKAMGKKVFQKSKDSVLDIAWQMAGMERTEATKHVGKAA